MKQQWQRLVLRIDALSLRERAIIFALSALVLITLVNTALLNPQYAKQKQLTQRIKQDQLTTAGMQAQIQQKMTAHEVDPDTSNKEQLVRLQQQAEQMRAGLRDMEKGLVSPDKMSALLEDILKKNTGLRLVSLKTISASPLSDQLNPTEKSIAGIMTKVTGTGKAETPQQGPAETVYKHGVEIVVQGGYLDLMNYLLQLEAMPWHLFWSKARLNVDEYPQSTLTLTLFTLSLDKKWLYL